MDVRHFFYFFIYRNTLGEGKAPVVKKREIHSIIGVSEKRGPIENKERLQRLNRYTMYAERGRQWQVKSQHLIVMVVIRLLNYCYRERQEALLALLLVRTSLKMF